MSALPLWGRPLAGEMRRSAAADIAGLQPASPSDCQRSVPPQSRQQHRIPLPGDTFAVPLGPAGFAAVRVLRTVTESGRVSALVAVTPWLAPHPPDLGDATLREILRQHRGRFGGRPAICWYEGTVPPEIQHIGTLAPTVEELALDPQGRFCGTWSTAVAHDLLRERGLPVDRHAAPLTSSDIDRVTGVMTEDEFWNAIQLLDWNRHTDEDVVAPLLSYLAQLPVSAIAGFHRKLCEKLFELDREEVAREIGEHAFEAAEDFSTDHFLDARCAAVAQGRDFYHALLSNPRRMIRDREFEILATVAEDAYRQKTGRQVVFLGAKPVKTFSNRAGWSQL